MTSRPVLDPAPEMINLDGRFVLMADNTTRPIVKMLDGDGDETGWLSIAIGDVEEDGELIGTLQ